MAFVVVWVALIAPGAHAAGKFKSVSAGALHTCAVRADDTLACWGDNGEGQTNVPAGAFKSVSAGGYHTCAVRADDTLACWGWNWHGQTNAPAGAFKSVSAGDAHTCAVTADDTLACWGHNESGQTAVPAGAFKSVSADGAHTCAVRADDTLACWGWNRHGQTNPLAGAFESVSAGGYHTCAVRADDTLACWGYNGDGQTAVPAGAFKSVSAGAFHTCTVRADDTLACWGWNPFGQTAVPAGAFKFVSAGGYHTCAVRADDTLACWGYNEFGQTDVPAGDTTPPTVSVTGVSDGARYLLGSVPTAGCDTQDSESGVAAQAQVSISGGPVGTVTVTCAGARDNAGNLADPVSVAYEVHWPTSGLLRPIDVGATFNAAKAGSAVPVKFSLRGDRGLGILAAGSPSSQAIPCDGSVPVDPIEQTVTAGASGLTYDAAADQYSYVWKSDKAWTGCRQLTLRLIDGSSQTAKFKFN